MKEQNTDICVVMDMDEEHGTLTVYSPVTDQNIVVPVTDDIITDVNTNDGVAFEIDLDTKKII